jgi:hypothetical protein
MLKTLRIVISIIFLATVLQGVSRADTPKAFEEIVVDFDDATRLNMEFFDKGENSRIEHWFNSKIVNLSEAQLRQAGMESYDLSKQDRKYFQLTALLLHRADSIASQSWLNPSDKDKNSKSPFELRKEAVERIDSTRKWKGFAAFQAADDLSHLSVDSRVIGPAFTFHRISSSAGIQRSFLSLGYLTREYRLSNPNYKEMRGLIFTEETHFNDASYCSAEYLSDPLFPYEQSLCDIAATEAINTRKAGNELITVGINKDAAKFFGLLGLIGLAIIEKAAENPNATYSNGISPLRGPSELETHLWLNPRG